MEGFAVILLGFLVSYIFFIFDQKSYRPNRLSTGIQRASF